MSLAPIRIIGIGSPFGDDQLGWLAAEALRRRLQGEIEMGAVAVSRHDRPGSLIVAELEQARAVILLDAVHSGAPAGALHNLDGHALVEAGAALSTHDIGVVAALQLARALGQLPEMTVVIGLEADPAWRGEGLSSAVQRGLGEMIEAACARIRHWQSGSPDRAQAG